VTQTRPAGLTATSVVAASSANLGPGFDALAIALKVYLECRFSVSNHLSIRVTGRDAHLIPATEENLKKSGYLLRCYLAVHKGMEVKTKVLDAK